MPQFRRSTASFPPARNFKTDPFGVTSWLGVFVSLFGILLPGSYAGHAQENGVMTLRDVVALALEKSPELAVYSAEMRASEARLLQADKKPNPEIGLALEDFAGSGPYSGLNNSQSTLRLSGLIELGGKRGGRREAAEASRDLAGNEYELKRNDVLAEVTEKFIDVVGAQEELELAREATAAADTVLSIVRLRVGAGRASSLEEKKAAVEVARTLIEGRRAEGELAAAQSSLVATWGGSEVTFSRAEAELFDIPPIPTIDTLLVRIAGSPEIARWQTEKRLREAEIRHARATRSSDLTLGGGVRHYSGPDAFAFVAELSIPLALFDRKQGRIAESEAMLEKSEAAQQAAQIKWRAVLIGLHQALANAAFEVDATRREVLPQAEEALRFAEQGYREGRFSYLELADAQRTLLDLRRELVVAAMTFHVVAVEIERLSGQPLNR